MMTLLLYLKSKNKVTYKELAKKHDVSALYVYRLARGAKVISQTDNQIIKALIEKGIVSGVRFNYTIKRYF